MPNIPKLVSCKRRVEAWLVLIQKSPMYHLSATQQATDARFLTFTLKSDNQVSWEGKKALYGLHVTKAITTQLKSTTSCSPQLACLSPPPFPWQSFLHTLMFLLHNKTYLKRQILHSTISHSKPLYTSVICYIFIYL